MKEGFNLIVDLFKGGKDPDQNINMEEFLRFIKTPPYINRDHISLISMKHDILTKKVVEDLKKDFDLDTAQDILEAGDRVDFLTDPLESHDFHEKAHSNKLNISMWETFVLFDFINQNARTEPERYHL